MQQFHFLFKSLKNMSCSFKFMVAMATVGVPHPGVPHPGEVHGVVVIYHMGYVGIKWETIAW